MPRVEFEVSERTIDTVKRIEERFQFHKIETTVTALNLFALALHAQEATTNSSSTTDRLTVTANSTSIVRCMLFTI